MTILNVMQPGRVENFSSGKSLQKVASEDVPSNVVTNLNPIDGSDRSDISRYQSNEVSSTSKEPQEGGESLADIQNKEVGQLIEDVNFQLEQVTSYLRFEQDKDSERMVIFIKNGETDELIRQIPSQEFLRISKNISQFLEMQQQSSKTVATPVGLIADLEV